MNPANYALQETEVTVAAKKFGDRFASIGGILNLGGAKYNLGRQTPARLIRVRRERRMKIRHVENGFLSMKIVEADGRPFGEGAALSSS